MDTFQSGTPLAQQVNVVTKDSDNKKLQKLKTKVCYQPIVSVYVNNLIICFIISGRGITQSWYKENGH